MDLRMHCMIFTLFASSSLILATNSTTATTTTLQAVTNATESITNITRGATLVNSTATTLGGNNSTDNETTTMPGNFNFSMMTTEIYYNATNVTMHAPANESTTAVTATDATINSSASITQAISPTTVPNTTAPASTSASSSFEETTDILAPLTIVDEIMNKWNESIFLIDFTDTSLNGTALRQVLPSEVVGTIIMLFKEKNQNELQSSIDEDTFEVAKTILQNKPSVLDDNITNQFGPNLILNLRGLYVNLHWFHDEVLCRRETLQDFVGNFALTNAGNFTNTSVDETSLEEFLDFIFMQPTTQQLFEKICEVASDENVVVALCSTPAPSTTTAVTSTASPIQGTEDFQNTWNQVQKNFTFLSDLQTEQLNNVTSSDMTNALVSYVNNLTDNEVANLVTSNFTLFAGDILRGGGNSATAILGNTIVDQLGDDVNKTDIFFVYMTFINAFLNDDAKFEAFLRSYVDNSSVRRRKRATDDCDTSSINADGIICHLIATEGSNTTALLEAVCAELDTGNSSECLNTIPESEPTNESTVKGLSTGEIIGIVLGCIFGLLLVIIVAFLIWKYCCSNKRGKVSPRGSPVDDSDDDLSNRNRNQQHRTSSRASAAGHPPSPDNNGSPQ